MPQGCAPSRGLWLCGPEVPGLAHASLDPASAVTGSSVHASVSTWHSPTRTLALPGTIRIPCLNAVLVAETLLLELTFTFTAACPEPTHLHETTHNSGDGGAAWKVRGVGRGVPLMTAVGIGTALRPEAGGAPLAGGLAWGPSMEAVVPPGLGGGRTSPGLWFVSTRDCLPVSYVSSFRL